MAVKGSSTTYRFVPEVADLGPDRVPALRSEVSEVVTLPVESSGRDRYGGRVGMDDGADGGGAVACILVRSL